MHLTSKILETAFTICCIQMKFTPYVNYPLLEHSDITQCTTQHNTRIPLGFQVQKPCNSFIKALFNKYTKEFV